MDGHECPILIDDMLAGTKIGNEVELTAQVLGYAVRVQIEQHAVFGLEDIEREIIDAAQLHQACHRPAACDPLEIGAIYATGFVAEFGDERAQALAAGL